MPRFLEALTSASAQAAISHASAFASVDINVALDVFVGCLEKASRCMVRKKKKLVGEIASFKESSAERNYVDTNKRDLQKTGKCTLN